MPNNPAAPTDTDQRQPPTEPDAAPPAGWTGGRRCPANHWHMTGETCPNDAPPLH